ncbi:MAG: glycosyltransferase [Ginsengibacter sp.]
MKVLFVSGKYLPYKIGGIENYSHILGKALRQNGHSVDVAILDREKVEDYRFEETNVFALQAEVEIFTTLLKKKEYDICHFHEYHGPRGINIAWLKVAKLYCQKVFFTFHLPYLTCYKNDFRYKGLEDCDNFSDTERCIKCILASRLKYKPDYHSNLYNSGVNFLISATQKASKVKELGIRIQSGKDDLNELINMCDQIFIYGKWFKNTLIKNGFSSPKLKLIPHVINSANEANKEKNGNIKGKILFAGRVERQKGLHLLCKAMNLLLRKDIQLDVAGNIEDGRYFKFCSKAYSFNYLGALPHDELLSSLTNYDFLILPSVFTEMYSLVLREAFQKKLPVIGSAAKGNVDVIVNNKNGFIFKYNNFKDLAITIDKAYKLLKTGWLPVIETDIFNEIYLQEILSYYKPDSIASEK